MDNGSVGDGSRTKGLNGRIYVETVAPPWRLCIRSERRARRARSSKGPWGRTGVEPWRGSKLVDAGQRRAIRAAASQQRGRDSEARRRLAPRKWARPPARPGAWPQLGGGWALARSLLRALLYSY